MIEEPSEKSEQKLNINKDIFEYLKQITLHDKKDRIDGSINLLRLLAHQKTKKNELMYSLKRLIRGVGSSTIDSRAGFFTSLVGFLKVSNASLSCNEILDLTAKELAVGSVIINKEDCDGVVGMILVCGAIIRSGKLRELDAENVDRLTALLINSSKNKTYHQMLAYRFLVEMLQDINEEQLKMSVLPAIKEEVNKCNGLYNLAIMYVIIEIFKNFPYLDSNIIGPKIIHAELVNPGNFQYFSECLLKNNNSVVVMPAVIESIGSYLANCNNLEVFWLRSLEPRLNDLKKPMEISIIKIAKIILANTTKEEMSFLLSKNFLTIIINGLKSKGGNNKDKIKEICNDFFEALLLFSNKTKTSSEERLKLIKKLILHPGTLEIEKYTSKRIIHQIISKCDSNSITALYEIYKQIFLNKLYKNPEEISIEWSRQERCNAGYMMQYLLNQKVMQTSCKWKIQELNLIMTLGFFYTNNDHNIIELKENGSMAIDEEFSKQMKDIFFSSLQNKFSTLENEKKILLNLVNTCNEVFQKYDYNKCFRFPVKENLANVWGEMFKEIQKLIATKHKSKNNSSKELDHIFSILLMYMGLQLFKNPDMAETAIADLEVCMIKSKKKISAQSNNESKQINLASEEPEWIEVVVDLFLNLLSQNSNSLRNIVVSVFPHLCEFLTVSTMHQILEMFIMKDGFNPLIEEGSDDINNSNMDNELEPESDDDESKNDSDSDEVNSKDDDSNSDNDSDNSSEQNEEDISEEPTEVEKFRNVLSLALTNNGMENDGDSIDVDDMDEEEGRRLDEVLAEAFRMRNKNNQKVNKRSKSYRTETTALMHFRIRVLDLVDIYIQKNPSLVIALEIMISLFNALEHCDVGVLTQLSAKIEKILNKITNTKTFSIEDVTEDDFVNYFTNILHKKFKGDNEVFNKIRFRCILFFIQVNNSILKEKQNEKGVEKRIIIELENCIKDFITSRNPIVNINFLKHLFKSSWNGVWNLSATAIENGLTLTIRSYRRVQIIELLEQLYINRQLIKQNEKLALKSFNISESKIGNFLASVANENTLSSKEFNSIMKYLLTAIIFHKKNQSKTSFIDKDVCNSIQEIRKKIKLESVQNYIKLCLHYNLEQIKNDEFLTSNNDCKELKMGKNKRKNLNIQKAGKKTKIE